MNNYIKLQESIKTLFKNKEIKEKNIPDFKNLIKTDKVIQLLKEIVLNDDLLIKIANRSYTHALGFDKIVLMDLKKDCQDVKNKIQLRLHIWDNENAALPIVEAMHEHSFDFISMVITGKLENQRFSMNDLDEKQNNVIEKLVNFVKKSDVKLISKLNENLEIMEALRLRKINSEMLIDGVDLENYSFDAISEETGFSIDELSAILGIQGHYVSNRVSGERDNYKHILNKYVSINTEKVVHINKNEYYFHPYQLPHRLYYDNTILNSTILLTTEVLSNPQGGSLQRPTYQTGNEANYSKVKLNKNSLRLKLLKYIKNLEEL